MTQSLNQSLNLFLKSPTQANFKLLEQKMLNLMLFLDDDKSNQYIKLYNQSKLQRVVFGCLLMCYPALLGLLFYGFEKMQPKVWMGVLAFLSTSILLKLTHTTSCKYQKTYESLFSNEIEFRKNINQQLLIWSRGQSPKEALKITQPSKIAAFKSNLGYV